MKIEDKSEQNDLLDCCILVVTKLLEKDKQTPKKRNEKQSKMGYFLILCSDYGADEELMFNPKNLNEREVIIKLFSLMIGVAKLSEKKGFKPSYSSFKKKNDQQKSLRNEYLKNSQNDQILKFSEGFFLEEMDLKEKSPYVSKIQTFFAKGRCSFSLDLKNEKQNEPPNEILLEISTEGLVLILKNNRFLLNSNLKKIENEKENENEIEIKKENEKEKENKIKEKEQENKIKDTLISFEFGEGSYIKLKKNEETPNCFELKLVQSKIVFNEKKKEKKQIEKKIVGTFNLITPNKEICQIIFDTLKLYSLYPGETIDIKKIQGTVLGLENEIKAVIMRNIYRGKMSFDCQIRNDNKQTEDINFIFTTEKLYISYEEQNKFQELLWDECSIQFAFHPKKPKDMEIFLYNDFLDPQFFDLICSSQKERDYFSNSLQSFLINPLTYNIHHSQDQNNESKYYIRNKTQNTTNQNKNKKKQRDEIQKKNSKRNNKIEIDFEKGNGNESETGSETGTGTGTSTDDYSESESEILSGNDNAKKTTIQRFLLASFKKNLQPKIFEKSCYFYHYYHDLDLIDWIKPYPFYEKRINNLTKKLLIALKLKRTSFEIEIVENKIKNKNKNNKNNINNRDDDDYDDNNINNNDGDNNINSNDNDNDNDNNKNNNNLQKYKAILILTIEGVIIKKINQNKNMSISLKIKLKELYNISQKLFFHPKNFKKMIFISTNGKKYLIRCKNSDQRDEICSTFLFFRNTNKNKKNILPIVKKICFIKPSIPSKIQFQKNSKKFINTQFEYLNNSEETENRDENKINNDKINPKKKAKINVHAYLLNSLELMECECKISLFENYFQLIFPKLSINVRRKYSFYSKILFDYGKSMCFRFYIDENYFINFKIKNQLFKNILTQGFEKLKKQNILQNEMETPTIFSINLIIKNNEKIPAWIIMLTDHIEIITYEETVSFRYQPENFLRTIQLDTKVKVFYKIGTITFEFQNITEKNDFITSFNYKQEKYLSYSLRENFYKVNCLINNLKGKIFLNRFLITILRKSHSQYFGYNKIKLNRFQLKDYKIEKINKNFLKLTFLKNEKIIKDNVNKNIINNNDDDDDINFELKFSNLNDLNNFLKYLEYFKINSPLLLNKNNNMLIQKQINLPKLIDIFSISFLDNNLKPTLEQGNLLFFKNGIQIFKYFNEKMDPLIKFKDIKVELLSKNVNFLKIIILGNNDNQRENKNTKVVPKGKGKGKGKGAGKGKGKGESKIKENDNIKKKYFINFKNPKVKPYFLYKLAITQKMKNIKSVSSVGLRYRTFIKYPHGESSKNKPKNGKISLDENWTYILIGQIIRKFSYENLPHDIDSNHYKNSNFEFVWNDGEILNLYFPDSNYLKEFLQMVNFLRVYPQFKEIFPEYVNDIQGGKNQFNIKINPNNNKNKSSSSSSSNSNTVNNNWLTIKEDANNFKVQWINPKKNDQFLDGLLSLDFKNNRILLFGMKKNYIIPIPFSDFFEMHFNSTKEKFVQIRSSIDDINYYFYTTTEKKRKELFVTISRTKALIAKRYTDNLKKRNMLLQKEQKIIQNEGVDKNIGDKNKDKNQNNDSSSGSDSSSSSGSEDEDKLEKETSKKIDDSLFVQNNDPNILAFPVQFLRKKKGTSRGEIICNLKDLKLTILERHFDPIIINELEHFDLQINQNKFFWLMSFKKKRRYFSLVRHSQTKELLKTISNIKKAYNLEKK
ncbi:nnp-1 protein putative nuclear protein 1 nop52 [Anaeramoeba flamelloides]|uniref:Nnp-1 protein putative nuclear protein 1 nop52 n=1 Tax=Anaeramoeba flamelloides TaxID=1746091 RepID=A0ABQ8Z0U5_9EUKA|nr:nnp-1 protein putative nuclear protein 1 nop52 [Anaeramoeba flamelloides]